MLLDFGIQNIIAFNSKTVDVPSAKKSVFPK